MTCFLADAITDEKKVIIVSPPTNRSLVYLIIFFFCAQLMPKAEKHTGSFGFEGASCSAEDMGRVISKESLQIAHLYPMSVSKFSKQKHTE